MKTKTKLLIIGFLAAISASCLLNSCSLIGLGIGASIDKKKPKTSKIYKSQIDTLKIGSQLEIILFDGNKKYGKYGGMVQVYDQYFQMKYDSIQNSIKNQVNLPCINDTILIYLASAKNEGKLGIFKGFESGKLWYKNFYSNNFYGIELSLIDNFMVNYNFSIDSVQIDNLIISQKFPIFLNLKIGTQEETSENIPLVTVSKIQVLTKRNAKFVGLGIGLAIDAIIAAAAVKSMQSMSFEMSF